MIIWRNRFFIIKRILINKFFTVLGRDLLKIERLKCEYRVNVCDGEFEWRDIVCARLLMEGLLRLPLYENEFNSTFGYYLNDPHYNNKMKVPETRRFSTIFGMATNKHMVDSFFANLYWFHNFHYSHMKQEVVPAEWKIEAINNARLFRHRRIDAGVPEDKAPVDKDILKLFVHTKDLKIMSLVDINEGREKERTSILTVREPGCNRIITLHCFYFNFFPSSVRIHDDFKRHFAIDFEFNVDGSEQTNVDILYSLIVFITGLKLNWVWVEREIVHRFKDFVLENETFSNKGST